MFSTAQEIRAAALLLETGEAVVFPTETVYGLGAHSMMDRAVARIFAIKGRPQDNPLIVHVASVESIGEVAADTPSEAEELFRRFSPGPLTIVLPALPALPSAVSAGLGTVAIRIPSHPVAQELLNASGVPVAAPSANRSGEPSPTSVEMARRSLGDGPAAYLDGGRCEVGLESTVVRITAGGVIVLRPGAITVADIETALPGVHVRRAASAAEAVHSPGVRHRHYSPQAKVLLFRDDCELRQLLESGDATTTAVLLPDDANAIPEHYRSVVVRRFGSLEEYAQSLYGWFAELDDAGIQTIAAFLPPARELGEAIADRLERAAGEA